MTIDGLLSIYRKLVMNEKDNGNRYDMLMSTLIGDEKVAATLKKNIYFVGKYLSKVETNYDNNDEREIAYRELGSIAFSCIELLLKAVLLNVNKDCMRYNCEHSCHFICDAETIENKKVMDVADILYDSQLLWLKEEKIDELLWLREQRNGLHLSKNLGSEINDELCDKQYVQRMINCFLLLLDSLNEGMSYFYGIFYCGEQADGKEAEKMKTFRKKRQTLFCKYRLLSILKKLFSNQELTNEEEWIIRRLDYTRYINLNEILELIYMMADRHLELNGDKDDLEARRKELLMKINKYLKKETVKKRIMEYNGVKKQMENKQ